MNLRRRLATAAVALVLISLATTNARAVTIDWVTVGNPGNANDTTGYGAVAAVFDIGKTEVTIQQYADFLNAAARSDPYSLYKPDMATDLKIAGISRTGTSGAYAYSVVTNVGYSGNRPITYVSWFDAARFANWLHNGQGSGSTETGAYTLVGGQTSGTAPVMNPGARYWIPTENEWYKAAYYSPTLNSGSGGYYTYATQSNLAPGNLVGSGSNQANYRVSSVFSATQSTTFDQNTNYLTDAGGFTGSASYYGTFDQSGSVEEWNSLTGAAGTTRGYRGGYWIYNSASQVSKTQRDGFASPAFEGGAVGFRLAAVPEPSTYAMALAGLACGGFSIWRWRKRT